MMLFIETNDAEQEPLIITPLQPDDRGYHGTVTAKAVFTADRKTAEAVCTRVIVDNHLAEARR
jgi:hypothetical protein